MKRPSFLFAALAALLILSVTAPSASAVLVTYFNFNDSNLTSDLPGLQVTTITQPAPVGATASFVSPGTTLNIAAGDLTGAGNAIRLTNKNNGGGNDKMFQFSVNTIGLTNLSLSYATRAVVATPGDVFTQTLYYSTNNGATFTAFTTTFTPTSSFTTATFNLSSITALNNNANVIIRIGMTQNGGLKDDFNEFDNIQLNAAPIPEPATVTGGALALAAVAYLQRRRLRAFFPTRKKPG